MAHRTPVWPGVASSSPAPRGQGAAHARAFVAEGARVVITVADWDLVMSVNLRGCFLGIRARSRRRC